MAAVDLAALAVLWRKRTPAVWRAIVVSGGAAVLLLAGALGPSSFGVFRLAACGLFLHGSVVLAASAVLLWRTGRKTAVFSATAVVLLVLVAVDAFLIEPTWLEVSRVRLTTPKVTRPVRIVVVADLQTDHIGPYEREVFRRIMQEKPDLILLAGDYLQVWGQPRKEAFGQLGELLRELDFRAPGGVFAVAGNIDAWDWPRMFDGLPVTVVRATEQFETCGIRLTCLSVGSSFNSRLKIDTPDPDRFHVVLGHAPNFAKGRIEADLLVAGHTHGGQVCLPWIGPLLTLADVPREWASGLSDLPGGGKLLVSRGVGMERGSAPRLRFLCRPELVVVDLVPSEE